ncbi:hypothetical protein [Streptomyces echinatus]|uniref:Uncharacterized protein n=1 Tax=Streptomyces echinatus TaxID=67293 RepID=A0A7W9UUX6_9ACTN|nr:hypothetical protein [Streptomyces echinatus]MBB5932175.1 hypothetical protein [Streptomyces echinatus]
MQSTSPWRPSGLGTSAARVAEQFRACEPVTASPARAPLRLPDYPMPFDPSVENPLMAQAAEEMWAWAYRLEMSAPPWVLCPSTDGTR